MAVSSKRVSAQGGAARRKIRLNRKKNFIRLRSGSAVILSDLAAALPGSRCHTPDLGRDRSHSRRHSLEF